MQQKKRNNVVTRVDSANERPAIKVANNHNACASTHSKSPLSTPNSITAKLRLNIFRLETHSNCENASFNYHHRGRRRRRLNYQLKMVCTVCVLLFSCIFKSPTLECISILSIWTHGCSRRLSILPKLYSGRSQARFPFHENVLFACTLKTNSRPYLRLIRPTTWWLIKRCQAQCKMYAKISHFLRRRHCGIGHYLNWQCAN